ncbi:hypothetical protein FRC02_008685 [Tulasnella sp. 418]|nr:hypothetical protein FRC02_008685 [Tulasnella sp. 418]
MENEPFNSSGSSEIYEGNIEASDNPEQRQLHIAETMLHAKRKLQRLAGQYGEKVDELHIVIKGKRRAQYHGHSPGEEFTSANPNMASGSGNRGSSLTTAPSRDHSDTSQHMVIGGPQITSPRSSHMNSIPSTTLFAGSQTDLQANSSFQLSTHLDAIPSRAPALFLQDSRSSTSLPALPEPIQDPSTSVGAPALFFGTVDNQARLVETKPGQPMASNSMCQDPWIPNQGDMYNRPAPPHPVRYMWQMGETLSPIPRPVGPPPLLSQSCMLTGASGASSHKHLSNQTDTRDYGGVFQLATSSTTLQQRTVSAPVDYPNLSHHQPNATGDLLPQQNEILDDGDRAWRELLEYLGLLPLPDSTGGRVIESETSLSSGTWVQPSQSGLQSGRLQYQQPPPENGVPNHGVGYIDVASGSLGSSSFVKEPSDGGRGWQHDGR